MGGDNKSHLDPTSEIRVGNFSGENDKWPSWCLKFESYCDLVDWASTRCVPNDLWQPL